MDVLNDPKAAALIPTEVNGLANDWLSEDLLDVQVGKSCEASGRVFRGERAGLVGEEAADGKRK